MCPSVPHLGYATAYNKQRITLDGQMDVNISFGDKQVRTIIYVKTEAPDPLLLSEAICRQLGIIHYHPNVKPLDGNGESEAAINPLQHVQSKH